MEKAELVFENQIAREFNNWNVRDDLKDKTLDEIKQAQPKLKYAVAAINVEKGLNVGSMIRSSVCFGANEFIIVGNRRYDKRSTVGAQNYIQITKKSFEDFFYYCSQMSYLPICIETNGKDWNTRFDKEQFEEHLDKHKYLTPCFLFGGESEGIPESMINQCRFSYKIDQPGVLRSLNVSVALGIVLNSYIG